MSPALRRSTLVAGLAALALVGAGVGVGQVAQAWLARQAHRDRGEIEIHVRMPAGATVTAYRAGAALDEARPISLADDAWLASGNYFLEVGRATRERLGVEKVPGSQAVLAAPQELSSIDALARAGLAGEPTADLWDVDIRRFSTFQGNPRYLRDRTVEAVGLLYANHWPFRQVETARPVRRSVLHDRITARGACFGAVMGWERANWYAPPGIPPQYAYSFGRQNWFPYAADEHRAVREAVGIFDQSSFAKFLLEGPDAERVLQRLCANDGAVAPGRIVYTSMLNPRGGIETDVTVTRLADERYFIVTSAAVATRDLDWIRRHLDPGTRAVLTDVSSSYATLGVMGPMV